MENENDFFSVLRNLAEILFLKNRQNSRIGSIGFQATLGSIVACALIFNAAVCFISGSLLIGAGVFTGIALIAAACELGYLRLSASCHRFALKEKIRSGNSNSIDRGTYFFFDSCFQLKNLFTYPRLVEKGLQTAIEAPILDFRDLKAGVQEQKSKSEKIKMTLLFVVGAPLGCIGSVPQTFFRKAKEKVKDRYCSVLKEAGYAPDNEREFRLDHYLRLIQQ